MIKSWTTAELSDNDQVGFWSDVLCQAFTPLDPQRSAEHRRRSHAASGLPGWVRSRDLGSSNVAEIASCAQLVRHGRREVARTSDDVVFVNLQLDGQCRTEQDGRQCVVRPGEFAIVDSTRPYFLDYREPSGTPDSPGLWRVLSLRLPRESLAGVLADPARAATATTFGSGDASAAIARALLLETWRQVPAMDDAAERRLLGLAHTDVTRAVLTARTSGHDAPSAMAAADMHRLAAIRHISAHLTSGRISAAETSRAIGVSVRTLHGAFERAGTTFGAAVRDRRLDACCRDLADGDRSIASVAARWGYADSAHMSKAVRARFGCTPTEYREQHRRSLAGPAQPSGSAVSPSI
ncbi:MAG: helix-turn-helix domain-containing protein [Gordonia paraffinivorans]